MRRYYGWISSLLLFVLLLTGCGKVSTAWHEQYDLGMQYLSGGNYEEAILAFRAAIEIEPEREEAYVQLMEIYIVLEEKEKLSDLLDTVSEVFGEEFTLKVQEESEYDPLEEPGHKLIEEEAAGPAVVEEVICIQKEWTDTISCFHVPQLNLAGGLGQEFNAQIRQICNDFSADYFGRSCTFDWYQYEDVIVIRMREFANAPSTRKLVYTISSETGKELTAAEVLARYDTTETEFLDKVRMHMGEFLQQTVWDITYANIEYDPDGAEWYMQDAEYAEEEAYSEENLRQAKPYVGKDGRLCFVLYVPGVVQQSDYFLVNYDTGETETVPECEEAYDPGVLRRQLHEKNSFC